MMRYRTLMQGVRTAFSDMWQNIGKERRKEEWCIQEEDYSRSQ